MFDTCLNAVFNTTHAADNNAASSLHNLHDEQRRCRKATTSCPNPCAAEAKAHETDLPPLRGCGPIRWRNGALDRLGHKARAQRNREVQAAPPSRGGQVSDAGPFSREGTSERVDRTSTLSCGKQQTATMRQMARCNLRPRYATAQAHGSG